MSHRFQEKVKNVQLLTNDDGRKAIVTRHLIHPDDPNFVDFFIFDDRCFS